MADLSILRETAAHSALARDPAQYECGCRAVLYDSISLTLGWSWILFWPTIVAAFPAAIFLHAKYRKAPRSYLIPRSGWRFWMAYVGFIWLPILFTAAILLPRLAGGRP
jgi:hypothetical protein